MSERAGLRPVVGATAEVVGLLGDWLVAEAPAPLLIETSGSTGRPKRVALSRDAVVASATATHERLGGPGLWTLLLPSSYVAGVQVVVRALLAGAAPDESLTRHETRSYVSVVPTQLVRMLADPDEAALLASYDAVLVGGASLDPALRARAEAADVRVVTTYGSSETAGGCVYDGYPLDGVRLRTDAAGRLLVGGPTLFDGYDADPALTAETLVDGWFRTSDLAEIEPDGRLRVLGRVDDVVNTGGVKVPAAAVARRLREHPDVETAEVLGVPDPEWGERVVAVVVGRLDLGAARDWVAAEHPRTWAPREVRRVDALPLLANGKTDRQRLRELVGA
ncbi:O-succinylbenzoic acid--CoA ligase [Marmoricola endophyticus]|uniref:O-succinylbenzoic acid--CoA ligase n=1 Tax=Marmoricola endophyticus TaxID=2040280 RepID=A0A917BJM8_9ACTN|nr:AMP-binding protein [Marmoricola endophyticus]GGF45170.1 O-succinylbenzoic acid--CoA ligase [Marmoricola endophyticus]